MENKPNIWVTVGLPGSGKSTIANKLIESGDFDGFEVSTNYSEVIEQLGPQNIGFVMDERNFPSKEAHIDAFAQYMIALHGAACDIVEQADIQGSLIYPPLVQMCNRMIRLPHSEFTIFVLREFFQNILFCQMFFNFYNTINVGHKAAKKAKEQTKPVMLTGAYFKTPQARNEIKVFLKSQGFDTQLLIVRSTKERLLSVAEQRRADPNEDPGRTAIELYLTYPPYYASEGWDQVVVVDNIGSIEEAVAATRKRISAPNSFTTTRDIPLVYEPRVRLK